MASASALSAMRVPGRVLISGTEAGLLSHVELLRSTSHPPVIAEEFGAEIVDVLWTTATYRLGMALRGWDTSVISKVFPGYVSGKVSWPSDAHLRSADAVSVSFLPRNSSYPSVSFDSAIPLAAEDLVVDLGKRKEHLILVKFLALRDGATPAGSVEWGP